MYIREEACRRVVVKGGAGSEPKIRGRLVGPAAFLLIGAGHAIGVGIGLAALLAVGGFGLGPAAAWLPELFAARYRYTAAGLAYRFAAILGGALPPVVGGPLQWRTEVRRSAC